MSTDVSGGGGGGDGMMQGISAGAEALTSVGLALGNRRFARKMARDNRAWDYRMWNEQNVYNSPLEQRKRLIAGGYNPQLALGGMSGNQAQLVHSSPASAPEMSMPDGVFDKIYNAAMQRKQLEVMDAQIAATKQQAALNGVKTTHEAVREARTQTDLTQATALYNLMIDKAHQEFETGEIHKATAGVNQELAKTNLEKVREELKWLPRQFQQTINESAARIQSMEKTATHTDILTQMDSERKKWMAAGMTSDQIARAAGDLLKILLKR